MNAFLQTARITLRVFTDSDLPNLHALNGDADVMRYIGDGSTRTTEMNRQWLANMIEYYSTHPGLGVWLASENTTGAFIGWFALKHFHAPEEIEVGYRLMKSHWGKGFATEGTKALLAYGFKMLRLERIVAVANPANVPSRHVLEKAGMRFARFVPRHNQNEAYYEITRLQYSTLLQGNPLNP
jgi:RimJ/RimL family protein N-acetyltransferase